MSFYATKGENSFSFSRKKADLQRYAGISNGDLPFLYVACNKELTNKKMIYFASRHLNNPNVRKIFFFLEKKKRKKKSKNKSRGKEMQDLPSDSGEIMRMKLLKIMKQSISRKGLKVGAWLFFHLPRGGRCVANLMKKRQGKLVLKILRKNQLPQVWQLIVR